MEEFIAVLSLLHNSPVHVSVSAPSELMCSVRGVVPATTGSGLSHGVRMCAYEGCFKILSTLTGGAAEVQVTEIE